METGNVRLKDVSPSDWIRCKYCQCFISTSSFVGHRDQHRKERIEKGNGSMKTAENSQNGWIPAQVRIKKEIQVIDLANSDEEESDEFLPFSDQCTPDPSGQPDSSPGFDGESDEFGSDLNLLKCDECEEYFFTGTDYDKHTAKYHCELADAAAEQLSHASGEEFEDSSCARKGTNTSDNESFQTTSQSIQLSNSHGELLIEQENSTGNNILSDSSVVLNSDISVVPQNGSDINDSYTTPDNTEELITSSIDEPQTEKSGIINSEPSSPTTQVFSACEDSIASEDSSASEYSSASEDSSDSQESSSSEDSSVSQDSTTSSKKMKNSKSKKCTQRKTYPQIQEYYVQRAAAKKCHRYSDNICPYCDKDCQTAIRWESHVLNKHEKKGKLKPCNKFPVVGKTPKAKQKATPTKRLKIDSSPKVTKLRRKTNEVANRKKNVSSKIIKVRKRLKETRRPKVSKVSESKQSPKIVKHTKSSMEKKPKMYSTLTRAQCQYCKVWITKQGLPYHLRIHTGEKPFSCMYCSAKFRGRSGLYCHEKNCRKQRTAGMLNNQQKKIEIRTPLVKRRESPRVAKLTRSQVPAKPNLVLTTDTPSRISHNRGVKRKSTEVLPTEATKICSIEGQTGQPQTSSDFPDDKLYLCDVCDFATFRSSELDIHAKSHVIEENQANIHRNVEVGKDSSVINNQRCNLTATTDTQNKLQGIKDDGLNQKQLLSPINNQNQVANGSPSNSVNSYRCLMCLRICGGESVIREHIKMSHGQTLQTLIRTDEDPSLGKRILKLAKKVSSVSRRRTRGESKFYDPSSQLDSVDETLPRLVVKIQGQVVTACSVLSPRRPQLTDSTEKNPFSCEFCSQKFVTHDDYLLHVVHHKGAAIRSCNQCGKTFLHSEFFEQHMTESHNVSVKLSSGKHKSRAKRKVRLKALSKFKSKILESTAATISSPTSPLRCDVTDTQISLSTDVPELMDDSKEKDNIEPLENHHLVCSSPANGLLSEIYRNILPLNDVANQFVGKSINDSIQNRENERDSISGCDLEPTKVVDGQNSPLINASPLTPDDPSESYLNICDSTTQSTDLVVGLPDQQLAIYIPPQDVVQKSTIPYSVAADPISPPLPGERNTISPYFIVPSMEWFCPDVSKGRVKGTTKDGNLVENSFRNLEMLSLIATLEPHVISPGENNSADKTPNGAEFTPLAVIRSGPENEHMLKENFNTTQNGFSEKLDSVIRIAGRERQFYSVTTENENSQKVFDVKSDAKDWSRRQCPNCCVNYENQLALEDHIAKVHDPKNVSIAAVWD